MFGDSVDECGHDGCDEGNDSSPLSPLSSPQSSPISLPPSSLYPTPGKLIWQTYKEGPPPPLGYSLVEPPVRSCQGQSILGYLMTPFVCIQNPGP